MLEGQAHPHSKKTKRQTELGMIGTTAGQWGTIITSHSVSSQIIRTRHDKSKQWYLNWSPRKLKIPTLKFTNFGHQLSFHPVMLSATDAWD